MTNRGRNIIFNAVVWAVVIVGVAFILRGTPYKGRVITVLSLGFSTSIALLAIKKK